MAIEPTETSGMGPSKKWIATGRRLNGGDDPQQPIEITEISRSFSMGDGTLAYGLPVDAPLGVQLIRNLWRKLEKEVPDPKSWIRTLLRQSFAMSLDKNILLKIISQPKCEGVRFYLCLKLNASSPAENPDVLSLVAVGVDAAGKDLLYDYNEVIHKSGIENIPTTSLMAEYGHPPGIAEETGSGSTLDPFVLFKYSE